MFGQCKDHVWPIFTSRPDKALRFSRLSQHGLGQEPMICFFFGTMPGPCFDHAGTILAQLKFQTSYGSKKFLTKLDWLTVHVYRGSNIWNHVRAILGSSLDHVCPQYIFRPARALILTRLLKTELVGPLKHIHGVFFGFALEFSKVIQHDQHQNNP